MLGFPRHYRAPGEGVKKLVICLREMEAELAAGGGGGVGSGGGWTGTSRTRDPPW